jgi:2-iminobutanoate/2-iminopropanoate deaminase
MRKQLVNPPQLHDGRPFGMSQAVIDTASATVYISGQVDWDENHQVSCHTVKGQLLKVLANLAIVLEASGSAVESLLSLRIYVRVRGELGEFVEDVAPILAQFLGDSRAAVTGIGVASLVSPELLVEIEATAALIKNLG